VNNADADSHMFEGIGYPITILGLLVLSVIWFRAIDGAIGPFRYLDPGYRQKTEETK
jgi:hypothetical protein